MVVFDFDGTIADSIFLGLDLINSYSEKFGYKKIEYEIHKDLSALQLKKEARISFLKIPYLVCFFRNKILENSDKIHMLPEAKILLEKLKNAGVELGILTSSSSTSVSNLLKKANMESYFSYIKTEVPLFGKKKALRQAKRQLKSNFVYVGDEIRDVEACHKTGVPIVAVSWGFNSYEGLEKNNPGLVARNAEEAFELIIRKNKESTN